MLFRFHFSGEAPILEEAMLEIVIGFPIMEFCTLEDDFWPQGENLQLHGFLPLFCTLKLFQAVELKSIEIESN